MVTKFDYLSNKPIHIPKICFERRNDVTNNFVGNLHSFSHNKSLVRDFI